MKINRILKDKILSRHKNGFIDIIYGPRRAGKTTLSKEIIEARSYLKWLELNGDNADQRAYFSNPSYSGLKRLIGNNRGIFIDEAQRITDIGIALKILIDNDPELFILVTGSSIIDLSKGTYEPLTGRTQKYKLFPVALSELKSTKSIIELVGEVDNYLRFGLYPLVLSLATDEEKVAYLKSVIEDYLFKDLKELANIDSFETISKLATLLAFQLGGEVSLREISNSLGIDIKTVKRYLNFLKQAFIIFEVQAFSKNLRKEINKSKKYYFWDLGIRNALINQFQDISIRNDRGWLWENFMALERQKLNEYNFWHKNFFFWRTYDGAEIDWIEEKDAKIEAFEFKYSKDKSRTPPSFFKEYKTEAEVINKENFIDFVN